MKCDFQNKYHEVLYCFAKLNYFLILHMQDLVHYKLFSEFFVAEISVDFEIIW